MINDVEVRSRPIITSRFAQTTPREFAGSTLRVNLNRHCLEINLPKKNNNPTKRNKPLFMDATFQLKLGFVQSNDMKENDMKPPPLRSCLHACRASCTVHTACTQHLSLASKKAHSELYAIFIKYVLPHPPPPFFLLLITPSPSPPFFNAATKQPDKKDFWSCHVLLAVLPSCPGALSDLLLLSRYLSSRISSISICQEHLPYLVGRNNKRGYRDEEDGVRRETVCIN